MDAKPRGLIRRKAVRPSGLREEGIKILKLMVKTVLPKHEQGIVLLKLTKD